MSQGAAQGHDIGQGNVQQDLTSCCSAAAKPELVALVLHGGTSECQASRICNARCGARREDDHIVVHRRQVH